LALAIVVSASAGAVAASEDADTWHEDLRFGGIPLLSLRITNQTEIESRAALDAYRASRHETLAQLAADDPRRRIEVVVTPDALRTIPEFLADLDCDCIPRHIVADVWQDGAWLRETGGGYRSPEKMAAAEERRARSGERKTVRSMEFRLPATDALALIEADHVLLVDPTTDVRDRHRWMALDVEVANAPDVFYPYMQYELGLDPRP
jgi:hypothetical protein